MKNERIHAIIKGKVQGVCYRMETRRAAIKMGVNGWVRNLKDGSVEAVFEGDESAVNQLLKWCWQGPASAKVENIETQKEDYLNEFNSFDITY